MYKIKHHKEALEVFENVVESWKVKYSDLYLEYIVREDGIYTDGDLCDILNWNILESFGTELNEELKKVNSYVEPYGGGIFMLA